MKKLLLCLFTLSLQILISCSDNRTSLTDPREDLPESSVSSASPSAFPVPDSALNVTDGDIVEISILDIAGIKFNNQYTVYGTEPGTTNIIEEFRSFITSQVYTENNEEWTDWYDVSLLDSGDKTLLKLAISDKTITFDRDVDINGSLYKKDVRYETDEFLYYYLRHFTEGNVTSPVGVSYPAKVMMPGKEYYTVDMINSGSNTINQLETQEALYAFVSNNFMGKEFELISCLRPGDEAMQEEEESTKKTKVIHLQGDSTYYIQLSSQNIYQNFVEALSIRLYRDAETPGTYCLLTNDKILLIKVDEAFDNAFQQLFDNDMKSAHKLNVDEVEKLFADDLSEKDMLAEKGFRYREFISRNLGMEDYSGSWRPDDTLERSTVKLGNEKTYTMLTLNNPFMVRLMFFNEKSGAFIDYVDFYTKGGNALFKIEKAGKNVWIVGNDLDGYGTGEYVLNRKWYTLDDDGLKLALSMPYDNSWYPLYHYTEINAEKIELAKDNPVRLKASYSVAKGYTLEIADTPGAKNYEVSITANTKVEFLWDAEKREFIHNYPIDDMGFIAIDSVCSAEIAEKCGKILKKEYSRLKSAIQALDDPGTEKEDFMMHHKTSNYEIFLNDCPESKEKTELLQLLLEK